jgi:hypothetical protein
MHVAFELAKYVFHNARAEAAMRRRRDGWPAQLDPTQAEPSICRQGPHDVNATIRCRQRTVFCRVGCEELMDQSMALR